MSVSENKNVYPQWQEYVFILEEHIWIYNLIPLNTLFFMSREIIWIKVLKVTDLWASAVAHTIK